MLSTLAEHEHERTTAPAGRPEAQRQPGASPRPARESDFEGIMQIEKACFPGELAYSREHMRELLSSRNSATFVEEDGRGVRGYVTAVFEPGTGVAGIETIGVSPDARGEGVGKRLLSAAESLMASRGVKVSRLEVSTGNAAAISLYSKAGYTVKCEIPDYYIYEHDGTRDAYLMEKGVSSGRTARAP